MLSKPQNLWETISIESTKAYRSCPAHLRGPDRIKVTLDMPFEAYLKALKPQIEAPHLQNRPSEAS